MKYAYFPGCSSAGTGVAFELSAQYVAKKIGMELKEIPDWNCCGAGHMTNHDAARHSRTQFGISRNLD